MTPAVSPVQGYFNANASDYSEFFNHSDTPTVYPTGRIRTETALGQIGAVVGLEGTRLVDFGCGTGRLVLECAAIGMQATGVDFSVGMLAEGRKAAAAVGGEVGERVRFIEASVFDAPLPDACCDAVTALGVIEYLPPDEAARLFASASRLLRPGGIFVLETRNRLFNMGSLNAYTQAEIDGGEASALLEEIGRLGSRSIDVERLRAFVRRLSAVAGLLESALEQDITTPVDFGAESVGNKVENPLKRWQHTPSELAAWGHAAGMALQGLSGLHPHPLPSSLERVYPRFYNGLALAFEQLSATPLTLGQCSSIICGFVRG